MVPTKRRMRSRSSRAISSDDEEDAVAVSLPPRVHVDEEGGDEANEDVRQFWRARGTNVFEMHEGVMTSFYSKRVVFNPTQRPRTDNWFSDASQTLHVCPTNHQKADILAAFRKNIAERVPVRVCLTRDDKRLDFGWMLPVRVTPTNYMVLEGSEEHVREFAQRLLPEVHFRPSRPVFDGLTNHHYNSLRELGWQRFMEDLEVPHALERDVPEFQTDLGPYTPDFLLYPGTKQEALLEIKPAAPYCDQEVKMRDAVEQSGRPGFILYGLPAPSLDNLQRFRSDVPSYAHAKGAKAIKFWVGPRGVRRSEGFVWMANGRAKPYLRRYDPFVTNRRGVYKYDWKHPRVLRAYKAAQDAIAAAKEASQETGGSDGSD